MNKVRNKKLFLAWVFYLFIISFSCFSEEKDLERMFAQAFQGGSYQEISEIELSSVEILFEKVLQGNVTTELKSLWKNVGYEMIVFSGEKGNTVILKELTNAKFGRGFYWINLGLSKKYALEIPHVPFDKLTKEISFQLISEEKFFAMAWNTVPRSYSTGKEIIDSDLAHLEKSHLMAFSRAISKLFPEGKIIQIHGFSNNKRKTKEGKMADMVVSSASKVPSEWVLKYANCMKHLSPHLIFVYPAEVAELGAITNTVALDLQKNGYFGFVHIEMNERFRAEMISSNVLRGYFLQCLREN